MTSQEPKTFFKKLKETCKKIDDGVSDVKRKLSETPGNEEIGAIRIRDYQDKIKSLKTQANELKLNLEPKLNHTKNFIQNFKELIVETEDQIAKQENYLKQYGYKPLDSAVKTPTDNVHVSPVKQLSLPVQSETELIVIMKNMFFDPSIYSTQNENPSTPSLRDYGIIQSRDKLSFDELSIPPKLKLTSLEKKENSDSTPTLEISPMPEVEKETPPMPEMFPNLVVFPSTPTLEL